MKTTLPTSAITRFTSGALLVAAALSLAACETTRTGVAGPAAQAQPAAAAVASAEPPNPMAPDRVTKSKGPMTHRQAALYCWMSTEHGRKDLPLDQRADIVDQCIKKKMVGG